MSPPILTTLGYEMHNLREIQPNNARVPDQNEVLCENFFYSTSRQGVKTTRAANASLRQTTQSSAPPAVLFSCLFPFSSVVGS
jgi:hypothetical protein